MIRVSHSIRKTPGKSWLLGNLGKLIEDANLQQKTLGTDTPLELDKFVRLLGEAVGYRFLHDMFSLQNIGISSVQDDIAGGDSVNLRKIGRASDWF